MYVCVCVLLLFVTFQQLLSRATARGTRHQTGRQSKNGQQKTDNNFVLIAVNFMREWAQVEQGEWLCGCCSEMRLALRIRPTGRSINQSSTQTKNKKKTQRRQRNGKAMGREGEGVGRERTELECNANRNCACVCVCVCEMWEKQKHRANEMKNPKKINLY